MNVDEDEEEEKKSVVHKPNITVKVTKSKPSKLIPTAPSGLIPDEHMTDFQLLDELFSILDADQHGEEPEPILCGYFQKIVQALLGKIKNKILYYILVKREGDIFRKLTQHMQHHSLAQLLVELMQVELPSQWDISGEKDSDEDEDAVSKHEETTAEVTAKIKALNEIFNHCRQEVITTLIDHLGPKNADLENTLNAQLVLTELVENKKIYKRITEGQNITKLINFACEMRNVNQAYALNVLTLILKEFTTFDLSKDSEEFNEIRLSMQKSFLDVTYSCLLILRASDSQLGEEPLPEKLNQAGVEFKRFGAKRMRSLELLKQIIATLSMNGDVNLTSIISTILKR